MWEPGQGGAAPRKDASVLIVTRTYLELRSPSQLRRVEMSEPGARFRRGDPSDLAHYRAIYRAVGEAWSWLDRTRWSDDRLGSHLAAPGVAVWELEVREELAGYFELERLAEGSVEIAYFGLVSSFFGRGLGGAMLTRAADEAWSLGANRVWLHTCTLDSPRALPNYVARGFDVFKVERYEAPAATSPT